VSHFTSIAILALPAFALVVAGCWLLRELARRPLLLLEDLALVVSVFFGLGSLVWLEAYLAGATLFGFAAPWTWLTAAHFAVAGGGALALSSLLVRVLPTNRSRRVVQGLLLLHPLAFALTAAGIQGVPGLDEIGALAYALLFVTQALAFVFAFPSEGPRAARLALGLALLVPVITALPAFTWAWGLTAWDLDEMIRYHGVLNAAGHVGLGLAAILWLKPSRRLPRLSAPLSKLASPGKVSWACLDRWLPENPESPKGLSPDFHSFEREDFNLALLDPVLIEFYEQTCDFELEINGRWRWPFRLAGRLWSRVIARALGQLGLPGPDRPLESCLLDSRMVDIDDDTDGRNAVRGWVRTWRDTGRFLYFATYAEHVREGVRYMNIAFPLPGANMTSLLHLYLSADRGLALTSRHQHNFTGDQGVYLVVGGRPWRLPLDETITLYPANQAPADLPVQSASVLVARHEMWFCGLNYLNLAYQIRRVSGPA
jgi:hypothetical protein